MTFILSQTALKCNAGLDSNSQIFSVFGVNYRASVLDYNDPKRNNAKGEDMIRTKHSAKLNSRTARRQLEIGKRHMVPISSSRYLIYRKPKSGEAGTWQACFVHPETKKQTRKKIGVADDFKKPDGETILSFHQAHVMALTWFEERERAARIETTDDLIINNLFTVANGMAAYFKDAERRGVKGVTQDKYRANAWILPTFGNVPILRLTREGIERWLDEIANSPKKVRAGIGREPKLKMPPSTDEQKRARKESANRVLAVFKAAMTYCTDRKLADSSDRPWQLVKRFRGTARARTRFLSIEEQVRLVNACQDDFGQLVRGALLTGCRYSEMTRFQCRDYDRRSGSVLVAESKSGKPRHVYLTEEGRELFDELTAGFASEDYVFTNGAKGSGKPDPGRRRWRSKEQCQKIREACRKAGIEPATFHELRHTYASMLVNRGCVLSVVAELLGHSSTKMVEKHYGHLSRSTVRDELLRAMPRLGILKCTNQSVA
jgi:integrase